MPIKLETTKAPKAVATHQIFRPDASQEALFQKDELIEYAWKTLESFAQRVADYIGGYTYRDYKNDCVYVYDNFFSKQWVSFRTIVQDGQVRCRVHVENIRGFQTYAFENDEADIAANQIMSWLITPKA